MRFKLTECTWARRTLCALSVGAIGLAATACDQPGAVEEEEDLAIESTDDERADGQGRASAGPVSEELEASPTAALDRDHHDDDDDDHHHDRDDDDWDDDHHHHHDWERHHHHHHHDWDWERHHRHHRHDWDDDDDDHHHW